MIEPICWPWCWRWVIFTKLFSIDGCRKCLHQRQTFPVRLENDVILNLLNCCEEIKYWTVGGRGGGIKRPLHFVSYLNIEMAPERTIKSFSCHDVRVSAMKHSKSFSVSWGNTSSSKRFWNYCQIICVQKLSYAFSVGLHHWKKCGNVIQIFDKCTYLLVFVYFLSWCVENVSERSAIFTFYKYDINPR